MKKQLLKLGMTIVPVSFQFPPLSVARFRIIALLSLMMIMPCYALTPWAYDLRVIAQTGQAGLTTINNAVSINSAGLVAFSGVTATGKGSFVADASGPRAVFTIGDITRVYQYVQLNDGGTIVGRRGSFSLTQDPIYYYDPFLGWILIVRGYSDSYDFVQTWRSDGVGGLTLVQEGRSRVDSQTFQFSRIGPFSSVGWNVTINNLGQVAFLADQGIGLNSVYVLATPKTGGGYNTVSCWLGAQPMIADTGSIAVRTGANNTDPILLYDNQLTTPVQVANTSQGFAALGGHPGISHDGQVVVFYGDLSNPNAPSGPYVREAGMQAGPGIFAAIDDGAGNRVMVRIAGGSADLGTDNSGQNIGFASFDASTRLSVVHVPLGAGGLDGDDIIVSFMATPGAASPASLFSNAKGIWTARGTITQKTSNITYRRTGLTPVVQIGDSIAGTTVNDLALYDSLALVTKDDSGLVRTPRHGEHRIAFWANTSGGNMVVRSTWLDSDEDCLPDHWEKNGVTIAGTFINLPAMGADPLHKDLFVHADWMNPASTYKFNDKALRRISDAFRDAPVSNPDGKIGIHLHVDAGAGSQMNPDNPSITWGSLSKAGMVPYQAVTGSCDAQGDYVWHDVDTAKQLYFNPAMRSAIFHYALFGNNFPPPPPPADQGPSSGISRGIPGANFLVTLGLAQKAGGTIKQQAGTFMHELGHNLGLHHGGADEDNCKPNYLSVMNYFFQLTGLQKLAGPGGFYSEWNYSTRKLNTLDENNLSESAGINDPDGHYTFWFGACNANSNYFKALPYPATDWDCSGSLTTSNVLVDVNGENGKTLLAGFNDWPAVVFDGGGGIGGAAASGTSLNFMNTTNTEPSIAALMALIPPGLEDDEAFAPIDDVTYNPAQGLAPLTVRFDGTASSDPDGTIVQWVWDFGNGVTNTGPVVTNTYTAPGIYYATLRVKDNDMHWNQTPVRNRVWVYAPFHLQVIQSAGSQLQISVVGDSSESYRLESSVDLSSWSLVTVLSSTNAILYLTNNVPGAPQMFLRTTTR